MKAHRRNVSSTSRHDLTSKCQMNGSCHLERKTICHFRNGCSRNKKGGRGQETLGLFEEFCPFLLHTKWVFGIPVFFAVALYLNTLSAGFVYDDHRAVLGNPDVLGTSQWTEIWYHDFWGAPLNRKGSHGSWRPLTTLSFRVNALLSQATELYPLEGPGITPAPKASPSPWSFHLVNVLLHAGVTASYLAVLQAMGVSPVVGLGAATLFAVHPVHAEAVSSVVGRAELLAALAFCLALGAYVRYLKGCPCGKVMVSHVCPCITLHSSSSKSDDCTSRRWWRNHLWLGVSATSAGLGVMCKEQAVTALGVGLVIHAALAFCHVPRGTNLLKPLVRELWPGCLGVVTIVWCRLAISSLTPAFPVADNPAAHASSIMCRVLTVCQYWGMHAYLLLMPRTLSFDWSMNALPLIHSPMELSNIPGTMLIVFLIFVIIITTRRIMDLQPPSPLKSAFIHSVCHDVINNNMYSHSEVLSSGIPSMSIQVAIGVALTVVPFLPASNLFTWVGFTVAERVLYLPSMGAALLVSLGAYQLRVILGGDAVGQLFHPTQYPRRLKRRRRVAAGIAAAWIILMASMCSRTVLRNQDWYSDETLFRSGIKIIPAKAWSNLGVVYSEQGRMAEAELAYREALKTAPKMADTIYNLGLLLAESGRPKEAIELYREALHSRPWFAQAHLALSTTLSQIGEKDEAVQVLRSCTNLSSAPAKDGVSHLCTVTTCRQRLARARLQEGKHSEALEDLHRALEDLPSGYPVHTLLTLQAEVLVAMGEHTEAHETLSRALASNPLHVPAHLALSKLLQANGSRVEEAERWLRRAVALAPNDSSAHKHLGHLLLEQGRVEESVGEWLRATHLDPKDHTAAFNAATALRLAGKNKHAEVFYMKAVQLQPNDVASLRNLGAILHLNGKLAEARTNYEAALRLSPGDTQTLTNLRRLDALLQKRRAALANELSLS